MAISYITLSRSALQHNIELLAHQAGGRDHLCPVIKGNAYGHGLQVMAKMLADEGLRRVAVISEQEAQAVYQVVGAKMKIMVIGYCGGDEMKALSEIDAEVVILGSYQLEQLKKISLDRPLQVYVQLDTGMHRYGFHLSQIGEAVDELEHRDHIQLLGLSTHLAKAWDEDPSFSHQQLERIAKTLQRAEKQVGRQLMIQSDNTAAAIRLQGHASDFARSGIGTYGYFPSVRMFDSFGNQIPLRPILSFLSEVVHITDVPRGEGVGYDLAFVCPRDSRIAIVPSGYDDGFPFAHSGSGAQVLIKGQRCPVVGRVNMNCILVDVTDTAVVEGDKVVMIGEDGADSISIYDWMKWGAPHLYECLTKLRTGLPRVVVD